MSQRLPLIYAGSYSAVGPETDGSISTPEWTSDSYTTPGTPTGRMTFADYAVPPGERTGHVYYCDNLGRIFEQDTTMTVPFVGTSIVVPSHLNMGDPGGGPDEGKELVRLWSYVVSEDSIWRVRLWPGNEYAYIPDESLNQPGTALPIGFPNYTVPGYVDNVSASRFEQFPVNYQGVDNRRLRYQPKTVHWHITDGKPRAGRGFIFEYQFINPVGVEFIGLGGVWQPGATSRPIWVATAG